MENPKLEPEVFDNRLVTVNGVLPHLPSLDDNGGSNSRYCKNLFSSLPANMLCAIKFMYVRSFRKYARKTRTRENVFGTISNYATGAIIVWSTFRYFIGHLLSCSCCRITWTYSNVMIKQMLRDHFITNVEIKSHLNYYSKSDRVRKTVSGMLAVNNIERIA